MEILKIRYFISERDKSTSLLIFDREIQNMLKALCSRKLWGKVAYKFFRSEWSKVRCRNFKFEEKLTSNFPKLEVRATFLQCNNKNQRNSEFRRMR